MNPSASIGRAVALGAVAAVLTLAPACATSEGHLRALNADLKPVADRMDPAPERDAPVSGARLEDYLDHAMTRSPALRASYERWRAEVARVGASDALPNPTLSYGLFVRSVETRVGPQRHRFGLRQRVPWPDARAASAEIAQTGAQAAQRRFEAQALRVRQRVGEAWWRLWAIAQTRTVRREQLVLLQQLADSARGRLEVGKASVSELNQLDLARAQLSDTLDALDARERSASARLNAAVGAPAQDAAPVRLPGAFAEALPDEDDATLLAAAAQHPLVRERSTRAAQSRAIRRRAEADRYPNLTLGVDYIETGERADMAPADNGKDPVLATVAVELPIWLDAYAAAERSAERAERANNAERDAAQDDLHAQVLDALATLRDTHRRIRLFRDTLIPQAETAYAAVLGDYETGRAPIATMLIAFRALLDLRLGLIGAQADHARAWVWLESAVGRPVRAKTLRGTP